MVAGGFRNDPIALGDTTHHDDRYIRLTEYTQIIRQLLGRDAAIELTGRFYSVKNLTMTPPLPRELRPEIFVSGSSAAGMVAAAELGATAVKYPQPVEFEAAEREAVARGVKCDARVGIVVREDGEEARHIALERFPPDRRGQLAHQMAPRVSDSVWHKQLSQFDERPLYEHNPYGLHPMQNYKTFCPYLVGSAPKQWPPGRAITGRMAVNRASIRSRQAVVALAASAATSKWVAGNREGLPM
jgi:alkanesulfonate monooxygenase